MPEHSVYKYAPEYVWRRKGPRDWRVYERWHESHVKEVFAARTQKAAMEELERLEKEQEGRR